MVTAIIPQVNCKITGLEIITSEMDYFLGDIIFVAEKLDVACLWSGKIINIHLFMY